MELRTAFLILVSVTLSAVAQITLKYGVSIDRVTVGLADTNYWKVAISLALSPAILVGLTFYFTGAVVWLFVLAKIDVTQAYPFVGLGFLITMVLGILLLGETVSPARLIGTILVATGVFLVAQS